jgi:hypothetical protein
MVLQRILILVAALFLLWRAVVGWGRLKRKSQPGADAFSRYSWHRRDRQRRADPEPEQLIECEVCGTLVPASRALTHHARVCCSSECLRALREGSSGSAELQ